MPPPFAVGNPDTITVGSASKAFWGGRRIGWIRAPRSLVRPLVESRASVDLGAAPVEQLVLAELLDRADMILDEQRARLREQRDKPMVLLGRELPDWRDQPAAGGQTVWAELPDPLCSQLVVAAAAEGLIITPGHGSSPWVRASAISGCRSPLRSRCSPRRSPGWLGPGRGSTPPRHPTRAPSRTT